MSETLFAVVNANGLVENVIVADQEFIDSLPDAIADDGTDAGILSGGHHFVNVTDRDPRPGVGWTRSKNGKFSAPQPTTPTAAELEAQAAVQADANARAEDDAFVAEAAARLRGGGTLTQDERDRLMVIQLQR